MGESNLRTDKETWRARLRTAEHGVLGAGVLLGDGLVLTCAHVVRRSGTDEPHPQVLVDFPHLPGQEWTASVEPGHWVPRRKDHSGDLALLRLHGPAPEAASAVLHRLPPFWGRSVRVTGYPRGNPYGEVVEAVVKGPGGPGPEWVQIDPVGDNDIMSKYFSGAGVVDNESGKPVGIVVSKFTTERDDITYHHGYMIPTGTIAKHLDLVRERWVRGPLTVPPSIVPAGLDTSTPASCPDHGFSRWLTRWLTHEDFMAAVEFTFVREQDADATRTLQAALARADRERSPRTSVPGAGTDSPPAGSLDLAVDVRGKTGTELAREIEARMGRGGTGPLPLTAVFAGVDQAAEPRAVLELLRGLGERRGRLLLVFSRLDSPALDLGRELLLSREWPERWLARIGARVAQLLEAEQRAEGLRRRAAARITGLPRVRRYTPDLELKLIRLRADPGRDTSPFLPKLSFVERAAEGALYEAEAAHRELSGLLARHHELCGLLDGFQAQLAAHGLAEAAGPAPAYRAAHHLLAEAPCAMQDAEQAVERFMAEARRAIDEGEARG